MWYTFCAKPMILIDRIVTLRCRSPCGERGLKCCLYSFAALLLQSLPVRGAWVEMLLMQCGEMPVLSLPVRGAWVEIFKFRRRAKKIFGRSPCGERGLKLLSMVLQTIPQMSLPVRGAWVEIMLSSVHALTSICRSPCGERGLKSLVADAAIAVLGRSPCGERGLKCWCRLRPRCCWMVAPRAGSVG